MRCRVRRPETLNDGKKENGCKILPHKCQPHLNCNELLLLNNEQDRMTEKLFEGNNYDNILN